MRTCFTSKTCEPYTTRIRESNPSRNRIRMLYAATDVAMSP